VAAASKRPLVNPSLHLDLALNLVVLQFVDDNGNVTNSFPSAKQLKAYRVQQASPAPTPAPVSTPVSTSVSPQATAPTHATAPDATVAGK